MEPLVLLDLDGTLIDSSPGILQSLHDGFTAAGVPVPATDVLRTFIGPPIHDSMRRVGVPEARVADVVAAYRESMGARGMYQASVYPGVLDALGELRAAGLRLAVATAKPEVLAVPVCDHLGLAPLLDGVVGAPLDEGVTKGDVVARAVTLFPGAAAMVGDREHDVHGAAENGLPCLGVRWGFAAPDELEDAGAVAVVTSPAELVGALVGLVGTRA